VMMYRVYILCLSFIAVPVLASSHHPQAFLERVTGVPDEGAQIVEHFCSTCHAPNPMIPLGAPKPGVVSDWSARLEQGLDILFKHADEGVRAMPPRGGCFECTEKQLWLAIAALLPVNEQKKILEDKTK
jgi:cytochrome c5